jgi:signal transduction histidine kinase
LKKTVIVLAFFISLIIGSLIFLLIPEDYFGKYKIEKISEAQVFENTSKYFKDLDSDRLIETVELYKKANPGHCIYIRRGSKLLNNFTFRKNETIISDEICFSNVNDDILTEMYFLTAFERKVFLHQLRFNTRNAIFSDSVMQIDSFSYYNNIPDVRNYEIKLIGNKIFFDLQAGYSIQPRKLCIYDFSDNSLITSPKASIVSTKTEILKYHNNLYFLPSKISASGNTFSKVEYEMCKKSRNRDTILLVERKKDKVYEYGDFSAYILLYNNDLSYAFELIEFYGWTRTVFSDFIEKNKKPHIVSLVSSGLDTAAGEKLIIHSLQGKTVDSISFRTDNHILINNFRKDKILVHNLTRKILCVYNTNLTLDKEIENIDKLIECYDINGDSTNEILTLRDNQLVVFSNDLKNETFYDLGEYRENLHIKNKIWSFREDEKTIFYFNTKMFAYQFQYTENKLSIFKYPVLTLLILIIFFSQISLIKINGRRLEIENIKLENIILERTQEIREKNEILLSQRDEISAQAEELKTQNDYLYQLSEFKKLMTDTIIHDLKTPLAAILSTAESPQIKASGMRMLNLISNILDVEKHEFADFRLNQEIHSLREILTETALSLDFYCKQKSNKISLTFGDFEIFADKEVLTRVFENLLNNALRFAKTGSEIEVSAREENNSTVWISVKNCGEIIPESQLETIFEKYSQAKIANTVSYKSTGIGLTYCRMALEAHGHTISARNTDEGAVVFEFSLSGKTIIEDCCLIVENKTPGEFDEAKKLYLTPFVKELNEYEVFRISEIMQILSRIENQSVEIAKWKENVQSAAFSCNIVLYRNLLERFELFKI